MRQRTRAINNGVGTAMVCKRHPGSGQLPGAPTHIPQNLSPLPHARCRTRMGSWQLPPTPSSQAPPKPSWQQSPSPEAPSGCAGSGHKCRVRRRVFAAAIRVQDAFRIHFTIKVAKPWGQGFCFPPQQPGLGPHCHPSPWLQIPGKQPASQKGRQHALLWCWGLLAAAQRRAGEEEASPVQGGGKVAGSKICICCNTTPSAAHSNARCGNTADTKSSRGERLRVQQCRGATPMHVWLLLWMQRWD